MSDRDPSEENDGVFKKHALSLPERARPFCPEASRREGCESSGTSEGGDRCWTGGADGGVVREHGQETICLLKVGEGTAAFFNTP